MSYTYIFINKSGRNVYNTIIISNGKLIVNNTDVSLKELESIEGEILNYTKLDELHADRVVSKYLPIGMIKFRIRNRDEITIDVINPFNIVEDLVLKLNIQLDSLNEPRFYLKESSVNKIVYSRI